MEKLVTILLAASWSCVLAGVDEARLPSDAAELLQTQTASGFGDEDVLDEHLTVDDDGETMLLAGDLADGFKKAFSLIVFGAVQRSLDGSDERLFKTTGRKPDRRNFSMGLRRLGNLQDSFVGLSGEAEDIVNPRGMRSMGSSATLSLNLPSPVDEGTVFEVLSKNNAGLMTPKPVAPIYGRCAACGKPCEFRFMGIRSVWKGLPDCGKMRSTTIELPLGDALENVRSRLDLLSGLVMFNGETEVRIKHNGGSHTAAFKLQYKL